MNWRYLEAGYIGFVFGGLIAIKYPFYQWQFWAVFLPLIAGWLIIHHKADWR